MNRFYSSILIVFFLTNILSAKTVTSNAKKLELINIVSQQQILAQRITKAYLYAGKKIAVDKANRQLRDALSSFYKTYSTINTSTKSPKIRKIMTFIKKSSFEFKQLSKKTLNSVNSKQMLGLSENVLAKSKKVAILLKKSLKKEAYESVSKSGQQQMLAERIAKYYIAYQSNSEDKSIEKKMKSSIAQFSKNHKKLMKNKNNTKVIKRKLQEVDKLWKVVSRLYNGKKLSSIVFSSTDDISKKMKEVTKLYMVEYR